MEYFKSGDRVIICREKGGLINISSMNKWNPNKDYSVLINGLFIDEEKREVTITGIHQVMKWYNNKTEAEVKELKEKYKIYSNDMHNNITYTYKNFWNRLFWIDPIIVSTPDINDQYGWYIKEEYIFTGVYPLDMCCFETETEYVEKKEVLLNEDCKD